MQPSTETIQLEVSAVLLKESDLWVAQCLEYDVAGQGETPQDADYAMRQVLASCVLLGLESKGDAFAHMPSPAPQYYWIKFAVGMQTVDSDPIPFTLVPSGAQSVIDAKIRVT